MGWHKALDELDIAYPDRLRWELKKIIQKSLLT